MFRHVSTALLLHCIIFAASFLLPAGASAQEKTAQGAPTLPARSQVMTPAEAQTYVTAQFGGTFKVLPGFPLLAGDLDGDTSEDLVIVATAKDPLLDESDYHYKTIDPYNSFFGFGDPQVTMRFVSQEGEPRFVLIVHGWKEATPKAKFVVINLPFEKLELARVRVKKKTLPALGMEDRTGQNSDIYWTGKQWKWADTSLKLE